MRKIVLLLALAGFASGGTAALAQPHRYYHHHYRPHYHRPMPHQGYRPR